MIEEKKMVSEIIVPFILDKSFNLSEEELRKIEYGTVFIKAELERKKNGV